MPAPQSPPDEARSESRWRRRGVAPGVVSLGDRASADMWSAPLGSLATQARAALEQWSGTELQDIVDLLRESLDVDVAAVSVLDDEAFNYLVCSGLGPFANPRDQALCDLVLEVEGFVEIPDLSQDERTKNYAVVDGRRMDLRYFGSCPLIVGGRLVGRVCLFDHEPRTMDAEGRRLLEVLARAASTAVDARVSHDMASPAEPPSSDAPVIVLRATLEALDTVLRRADVGELAHGLVGRALDMTSELGRSLQNAGVDHPGTSETVDLDAVMSDVRADLAGLIARTGGSVTWSHLGAVGGGRAELYSMLLNLVSVGLAHDHGESPPQISVSGEGGRDGFMVRVRDTGSGDAETDRRRVAEIFDEFNDPSSGATGLATVARIVAAYDGLIGVESGAGGGTEIWFTVGSD